MSDRQSPGSTRAAYQRKEPVWIRKSVTASNSSKNEVTLGQQTRAIPNFGSSDSMPNQLIKKEKARNGLAKSGLHSSLVTKLQKITSRIKHTKYGELR